MGCSTYKAYFFAFKQKFEHCIDSSGEYANFLFALRKDSSTRGLSFLVCTMVIVEVVDEVPPRLTTQDIFCFVEASCG